MHNPTFRIPFWESLSILKLKEMVLALTRESDLGLSDDAADSIVDKVSTILDSYTAVFLSFLFLNFICFLFFTDNDGGRFGRRWKD